MSPDVSQEILMRFSGKTVVVLGGNSGIGLAAAKAFQAEGARVAVTGRNEATLAAVAAEHGLLALRADVADVAASTAVLCCLLCFALCCCFVSFLLVPFLCRFMFLFHLSFELLRLSLRFHSASLTQMPSCFTVFFPCTTPRAPL